MCVFIHVCAFKKHTQAAFKQTQDGIRHARDLLRKNLKKKNIKDRRFRTQI